MNKWQTFYKLNIPIFDALYQEVFNTTLSLKNLLDVVPSEYKKDEASFVIDTLKTRATIYFSCEESIMNNIGYPELAMHQLEHTRFLDILNAVDIDNIASVIDIFKFLTEWTPEHISSYDYPMTQYYLKS